MATETTTAEQPSDFGDDEGASARRWISELDLSEKEQSKWAVRARKIVRRYKNESDSDARRFALLWSNIQTLGPAIYARKPEPVVSRRFKDEDPLGRVSAEVLERALSYTVDAYDFDGTMKLARDDFLLLARAQVWVRYEPHFRTVTPKVPVSRVQAAVDGEGVSVTDDAEEYEDATGGRHAADKVQKGEAGEYIEGEPYEEVEYEEVCCDHVHWSDFGTNPARTWAEVRYVWRRVYLTREELKKRFPKVGAKVPLDWSPKGSGRDESRDEQFKKAAVYEIWDKPSGRAVWVSRSYPQGLLDELDDPLKLKGFFPCPRPMLGTCGPDSIMPVPDHVYYQDQAEEVDELTARIDLLTGALRLVGFYAGEHETKIQNVFSSGNDNTLIPVDAWAAFKDGGGTHGLIEWVPLDMVVATLKSCIETRAQMIQDVYQITGVSDVLRGASDPNETATAQGIKAQWGSVRVRDRQKELARFARDIVQIKGEIIAEHFSVQTLKLMTDIKLFDDDAAKQAAVAQLQQQAQAAQAQQQQYQPPEALVRQLSAPTWQQVKELLENDAVRSFRIDIETDSTIEPNETEEKAARVEFVTALGGYIGQCLPAVQAAPQMMPLVAEGIKYLARGFRASREMEDIIERVAAQISQMPAQQPQGPPQPPPPDPADQQAKMLTAQAKAQDAQTNQQRAQTEAQLGQGDLQLRSGQLQLEAAALSRDPNPQSYSGGS